jgi:hypothetical protein
MRVWVSNKCCVVCFGFYIATWFCKSSRVESQAIINTHFETTHQKRPFQLHINWSTLRLGAVLTQLDDDGQEFVVTYANRSNKKTKAKYNSYEGECLVVVWGVSSFRCYLYGSPITLITDHQPLKFLMELDQLLR